VELTTPSTGAKPAASWQPRPPLGTVHVHPQNLAWPTMALRVWQG